MMLEIDSPFKEHLGPQRGGGIFICPGGHEVGRRQGSCAVLTRFRGEGGVAL
jgi:hypothetical protein